MMIEGLRVYEHTDRGAMDPILLLDRVQQLMQNSPDLMNPGVFPVGWWSYYKELGVRVNYPDGRGYLERAKKLGISDTGMPFTRAKAVDTAVQYHADNNSGSHTLTVVRLGRVIDNVTGQDMTELLSEAAKTGVHTIQNIEEDRAKLTFRIGTTDVEGSDHAFLVPNRRFMEHGYNLGDFPH